MSKLHVATIITPNHLDKAYTMLDSMRKFHDCHLHVLIVTKYHDRLEAPENENASFYTPNDIFNESTIGRINRLTFMKYKTVDKNRPSLIAQYDYLRWSLKAGFVYTLLEQEEMIVYCDNDLYFYNDYQDIIDYAKTKSITISPHWRTIHSVATDEIQYNFRHGLYNGGFFIVTQEGKPILEWWAERCCVECSATSDTTYVDQKYLDLVPLYFDNVGIIKHKGYNVAAWNYTYLPRTVKNGKVLVDGDEIVFIHFSPITIKYIEKGIDIQLSEHLIEYNQAIVKHQIDFLRDDKGEFTTAKMNSMEVI